MPYMPSPAERVAMLAEWEGKCAYDGKKLFLAEMEVDHVIPKSSSPEEVAAAIELHDLPRGFDVHTLENMAPTHRTCNGRKGRRPLPNTLAAGDYVKTAIDRAPLIRERAEKLAAQDRFAEAVELIWHQINEGVIGRGSLTTVSELRDAFTAAMFDTTNTSSAVALTRPRVRYSTIAYSNASSREKVMRRLWLLEGQENSADVAVVLEDPRDEGTSIQNAAARIARAVSEEHPGFTTVLHYDNERESALEHFWWVVPWIDDRYVFGESLVNYPLVAKTLSDVLPWAFPDTENRENA